MIKKIIFCINNFLQKLTDSEKVNIFIRTFTKLSIIKELELEVYPGIGVISAISTAKSRKRYLQRFKNNKLTIYEKITYKRTFIKPFRFLNFKTCYKRSSFERFAEENAFNLIDHYYSQSNKGKIPVIILYDNKQYTLRFKKVDQKPKNKNRYLN